MCVAGAAGGVGASTVALAVGGLLAWAGRRTLVVGDEDLLTLCGAGGWSGPGVRELAALDAPAAAAELSVLARPVAGVDRLAVLGGGAAVGSTAGWPVDVVVADLRTAAASPGHRLDRRHPHVDLLVARPDVSLRRAAAATPDVPVLLVGTGPLDRAGVRRVLGRAPVGWLPSSARVARGALAGRLPSALPGSFVAALRAVVGRVRR